jgi:hypothetical protein
MEQILTLIKRFLSVKKKRGINIKLAHLPLLRHLLTHVKWFLSIRKNAALLSCWRISFPPTPNGTSHHPHQAVPLCKKEKKRGIIIRCALLVVRHVLALIKWFLSVGKKRNAA